MMWSNSLRLELDGGSGNCGMITYALLIWVGVSISMPSSYFALLGIGALIKVVSFGYNVAKAVYEK